MKIAVRVDAAPALGSGHVVRTLTLADALRAVGHEVTFVFAQLPAYLRDTLVANGHSALALADDAWSAPLGHEWDPARQSADFAAFRQAVAAPDWVICDHYGLGAVWERAARGAGLRVMAIDDLGRDHDCELLLDQNFYTDPGARYRAGAAPTKLIGPRYALLRPAFAAARGRTAPRRGACERLLLFMGGIDAVDATSLALDAIEEANLQALPLDVVIGAAQPARGAIAARCAANAAWTLHVQTEDMAGLLARADLAIGAGGTATWERCALGVPTLAVELAANQREVLHEGARAGFLYALEGRLTRGSLALHLQALVANPGLREHLSARAWSLADGGGARRVAAALSAAAPIGIRRAHPADCRALYDWRNSPEVRAVSRATAAIAYPDHEAWFTRSLASPDRWLLVGERAGAPVGVVRFDRHDGDSAEVSIYLAPQAMGGGGGGPLLAAAEQWLADTVPAIRRVTAVVMDGNERSEQLFERGGYARESRSYSKEIK